MANAKKKKNLNEEEVELELADIQPENTKEEPVEDIAIENTEDLKHVSDGKRYGPPAVYYCINCKKHLRAEEFFHTTCK